MLCRTSCAVALAAAEFSVSAQDTTGELRQLRQRVEELEKKQRPQGQSAFNPDISLILQGTLARSSRDPQTYRIDGFAPSGGEVGPAPRGFGLGESELVVSSNIDPYLRGQLVAALTSEDEVEVEEAFFQTLALGRGFALKGGRFLSGIGYQNEIHQHAWDFQDAPLAYKAFLGGRLNDDAVQLRWVAPTDLFVELGGELGRGRSFPGTDRNRNGGNLWTLFGRAGGDLSASTAWRAGLSYVQAKPEDRAFTEDDVTQSFSGRSKLWIADAVLKWAPDGNPSSRNLKLQGEYFRRQETGTLTRDVISGDYSSRQSGWYAQAAYQFMPRWRAGYRYDRLSSGTVTDFGAPAADHNPTRNTAMVDFSPSEFSRFRLQYALDRSRADATDHQLLLQYVHSLGAHGAHRF